MSREEQEQKIIALEKENQALRERIAELERRLGLNSDNSSQPPSSDGLNKKPHRTKSLRGKSGRKTGGQKGHRGQTLEQVSEPDRLVKHLAPDSCWGCGCDVSREKVVSVIKRQVFDIPEPRMEITEHQVEIKRCPRCEEKLEGCLTEAVKAPVQYGVRIKAVSTYLQHQHFIPEDRLSEAIEDLYGCRISTGTIANTSKSLAQIMSPVVEKLAISVKAAPVKHLDETGFRICGKTQWLHVVSTETATWYRPAVKRKDLEPLEGITGRVIHDHWKSYFQLENVSHGLCNAHHLRELKALAEIEQESWAFSMRKLLTLANKYRHRYPETIPKPILIRLTQLYQSILQRGLNFHESQPPLTRKSNRGRVKRRVGHNLLLRLSDYASDVLRFLFEPDVPFTNNQAERDLRMMKCKQKISGCFRSGDNALDFAKIRSFLSTARKQNLNLLKVIIQALSGKPPVFS
ncbi:transposase [Hyella patelloides LEGE 07179]|uniref:Transposase n=1 Tax=Hyella patelloides LEGE 07179 TaxID=945734 RepID=A0A563VUV4_9CYAN|nr:IS66 family transposase [Hyella patelloides]VEP15174.1 transposase [Hyella patelloides LEGE 07179]